MTAGDFFQNNAFRGLPFRPDRAGNVTHKKLALAPLARIGNRCRIEQTLGVGMSRVFKDCAAGAKFDHLAQIHDRHPVRHAFGKIGQTDANRMISMIPVQKTGTA